MIYLDHNATTPLHPQALEAMLPFLGAAFGNPSSYHRLGREAKAAVDKARKTLAQALGAQPREIIVTSGGTEADNFALRGVAHALRAKGRHIITSAVEHHAVLKTCKALEKDGGAVTCLPVDDQGRVDLDAVLKSIRPDTILISVMYANNETGVVQPVEDIGRLAREHGVLFHTDAVQAFCKIPVVAAVRHVDLLSIASHKIYGPKGAGALFVRSGTPLAPLLAGGHHEFSLRAGTENVAALVGFAEAAALGMGSLEHEAVRLAALRDRLEEQLLKAVPDIIIHGKNAPRVPNTSNISFLSVESESILLHLDLLGICASAGSACTTGSPEQSHVLLAMGCSAPEAQGAVRFSLGKDTNENQINTVTEALCGIIKKLRQVSSM